MREDANGQAIPPSEMLSVSKAQLEQLQRIASVGAVASSIAHEFNNILTTILNQAKFGLRTSDPEKARHSFNKVLESAKRAAKITTGILALSRNRVSRMQPTDVAAMVDEVLAVVEKDLTKHQVRLERDFREAPVADMVAAQIQHVLMNLIINARQAMSSGGVVRVSIDCNRASNMVEIGIQDAGPGIEPQKLAQIFEPFFTTKQGPDQEGHGGSGLGLSICREIIERHQGRIRVESLVGKGTKFVVKLPCSEDSSVPHAA